MEPILRRFFWAIFFCCLGLDVGANPNTLTNDQIERARVFIGSQLARQPNNRVLRFRYAQASYQAGHHEAAKYHLRHLMRTSQSADELTQLQGAYGTVVADLPWSFGVNFSILPSTNINKTASNEIFDTPLGRFLIAGGGDEESGVGLRFGGRLNYETALRSGATLTYGLEVNRNQYPDDRLNRFDGTIRVTWGQRSLQGHTQVSPYIRRYFYDESVENNSTRYGVQISHEFYLTDQSSLTGAFTGERRDYDSLDYLDGNFFSTSLAYRGQLSERYRLTLGAAASRSSPEQEHLRYTGASVWGEISRSFQDFGEVGLNASIGMRHYDGVFPALDEARSDSEASLGISFRPQRIQVFGSTPKLSCRIQKNWSNVALYDFQSTDCSLAFERTF